MTQFKPVKSSLMSSYHYNPDTERLVIQYPSGQRFEYANVPAKKVKDMEGADSVGKYFLNNIKPFYDGRRV